MVAPIVALEQRDLDFETMTTLALFESPPRGNKRSAKASQRGHIATHEKSHSVPKAKRASGKRNSRLQILQPLLEVDDVVAQRPPPAQQPALVLAVLRRHRLRLLLGAHRPQLRVEVVARVVRLHVRERAVQALELVHDAEEQVGDCEARGAVQEAEEGC